MVEMMTCVVPKAVQNYLCGAESCSKLPVRCRKLFNCRGLRDAVNVDFIRCSLREIFSERALIANVNHSISNRFILIKSCVNNSKQFSLLTGTFIRAPMRTKPWLYIYIYISASLCKKLFGYIRAQLRSFGVSFQWQWWRAKEVKTNLKTTKKNKIITFTKTHN